MYIRIILKRSTIKEKRQSLIIHKFIANYLFNKTRLFNHRMVAYTFNLKTLEAENLCELQASLVYITNYRTAKATLSQYN